MGKSNLLSSGVSRRTFLKGSLALGAAVSLFGCSSPSDDVDYSYNYTPDLDDTKPNGKIEGTEFWGATPHNCGGENCILKAYVDTTNKVVKRIVTDERPDYEMGGVNDNPQDRACPRCRGRKSTLYYSNRLKYPLIQTGERGNLATFKKATWKDAMAKLAEKLNEVETNCGSGSVYGLYASGSGGTLGVDGKAVSGIGTGLQADGVTHGFEGFNTKLRSAFAPIQDYSWPAWEHVTPIIQGYQAYAQAHDAASNAYSDAINSDVIVIWGHNMSETQWTPQISYYLAQIKEKNSKAKIYLIDGRFSQTAALMSSHPHFKYVGIANGTDAALVMGMINHIFTDNNCYNKLKALYGASDDADLRKRVGKYLFGFFDTNNSDGDDVNKTYQTDGAFSELDGKLTVEAGASWSAYIFGNNDTLVKTRKLNQGTSIYPDQIGYNVRDYKLPDWDYKTQRWTEDRDDELNNKHTFCYGKVNKTPAWASKITGVPEDVIKQLAEDFLEQKVTVWTGSGFQRCTESEEIVRSWICFNTLVRNFGIEGSSFGSVGLKGGGAANRPANIPAHATGKPTKEDDGYAQSGKTHLTDPAKGGYNKGDKDNKIEASATLGARFDSNFCSIPITNANLVSDYDMNNGGEKPNVTPAFTWLENIEASLRKPEERDKVVFENGKFEKKSKQIRPARWNTGSNQTVSTPVGCITQMSGNQVAVTAGNSNLHTAIYNTPNMLDFIVVCDNVMTPSCRYADLVLPGSMGFERWTVSGNSWGGGRNAVFTGRATLPPGEALCELEIGLLIAQATGDGSGSQYANGVPVNDINKENITKNRGKFEEEFWKKSFNDWGSKPAGIDTWDKAKNGFRIKEKDPEKSQGYADVTTGANQGYENGVNKVYKNFRNNPKSNPLKTYTGRVEAYSLRYMEDYEARFFINEDERTYTNLYTLGADGVTPVQGGSGKIGSLKKGLYTKSTSALKNGGNPDAGKKSTSARYVYPVPMYIPLIEGRHADGSHPFGKTYCQDKAEYDLTLNTWHIMYRSHSTHNSSGLLNEVKYYKRDHEGNATYFTKYTDTNDKGVTNYDAITDFRKGAYETCWINPDVANPRGITEGDLVVIENDRGAIVASAHVSNRVSPGAVYIGHGSWYNPVPKWTGPSGKQYENIDVGGCANTLTNTRPSRMCQGMTLANDCRVKISKA